MMPRGPEPQLNGSFIGRSGPPCYGDPMKTRTLTVLIIVVAIIAVGTLVLRGEGGRSLADWFISLHGGGRGGH